MLVFVKISFSFSNLSQHHHFVIIDYVLFYYKIAS